MCVQTNSGMRAVSVNYPNWTKQEKKPTLVSSHSEQINNRKRWQVSKNRHDPFVWSALPGMLQRLAEPRCSGKAAPPSPRKPAHRLRHLPPANLHTGCSLAPTRRAAIGAQWYVPSQGKVCHGEAAHLHTLSPLRQAGASGDVPLLHPVSRGL